MIELEEGETSTNYFYVSVDNTYTLKIIEIYFNNTPYTSFDTSLFTRTIHYEE
jgi:hypothetical protein